MAGSGFVSTLPQLSSYSIGSEQVIKPAPLNRGDTIGLISPASIVGSDAEYDKVSDRIKQLGFEVKEGTNARNQHGYFAGRDKQRAHDLNAMFADPGVDAIMAFRGGWGSNRILEYIDYDLIGQNPKVFVGYSDITSLLLAIFSKTGLITFHGPVAKSVWTDFTIDHFDKAVSSLTGFSLQTSYKEQAKSGAQLHTLSPGAASGRLLGGNLSVLTSMIGSSYLPEWEGNILFLEDVGENVYRIDRMLTQLKLSGILNQISGFIFGQCTSCDSEEDHGFTLLQILKQHIRPLDIPAFSGTHIGHIDNMFTLPVGVPVSIDAEKGSIEITESAVKAKAGA